MKIEIEIPDDKLKKLANEIMENYPEYSAGNCLQCVSYKYKTGKFTFIDVAEDKEYHITTDDIAKTLPKFIEGIVKGEWKFYGFDGTIVLRLDARDYDSDATDAVVQLAIFGDIIYG
jgi:hypothetical protein